MQTDLIRKLLLAFTIFAIMSIVLNFIHESGHGLMCEIGNGRFEMHANILIDSWGICRDSQTENWVISLGGGGIAVLAAVATLAIVRKNYFITPVGSLAAGQFSMMIFETWMHDGYLTGDYNTIIGTALMGVFALLAFRTGLIRFKKRELLSLK